MLVLSLCVGCDQVTKQIARHQLDGRPPRSFLADTFRLVYAENPGAFLGLGASLPANARWTLLVIINSLVALGILGVLVWNWRMPPVRALACACCWAGQLAT